MRLTNEAISTLTVPPGKAEIIAFDDSLPGFGIRIRKGGSRRYIFQYKTGGINRRVTFKETDARRARKAAEKLAARVTLGGDPALEKQDVRNAAGDTFQRCMGEYLARVTKRRESTLREIKRHLLRNLHPLHRHHIKAIDRRKIAEQLSRLTVENGPVQSNRTRASLSAFFNWCLGQGYVDSNPVLQTNKNDEIARERVLGDSELRAVWKALPAGDYGDAVKLLILTAQRREEIARLRWDEINLTNKDSENIPARSIRLSGNRTKNGRPHIIPLSALALAILKARENGRDHVFGITAGFSAWSRAKKQLDGLLNLKPWTIHDLRRSAVTGMAEKCKVKPHVIEAVINHVSGHKGGIAGVYNRASYEPEKREALGLWAKYVARLVS
jgi:integrase